MSERDLLQGVKEALEKATPGPWVLDGFRWVTRAGCEFSGRLVAEAHPSFGAAAAHGNATLIANAPQWLAALVERCEQAEAERDAAREALEAIAAKDELLDANEGAFGGAAARWMKAQARVALGRDA